MKDERGYRSDLDKVLVKSAAVASLISHLSSFIFHLLITPYKISILQIP